MVQNDPIFLPINMSSSRLATWYTTLSSPNTQYKIKRKAEDGKESTCSLQRREKVTDKMKTNLLNNSTSVLEKGKGEKDKDERDMTQVRFQYQKTPKTLIVFTAKSKGKSQEKNIISEAQSILKNKHYTLFK